MKFEFKAELKAVKRQLKKWTTRRGRNDTPDDTHTLQPVALSGAARKITFLESPNRAFSFASTTTTASSSRSAPTISTMSPSSFRLPSMSSSSVGEQRSFRVDSNRCSNCNCTYLTYMSKHEGYCSLDCRSAERMRDQQQRRT